MASKKLSASGEPRLKFNPQQLQQQPPQQLQQITPVVAAHIPPPPPPPPAPPAMNTCRVNGIGNNIAATNTNAVPAATNNNGNSLQHSPIAANNLVIESNVGKSSGSPNQAVSLASELAKCQLRKVNLSRSDSDKEPECNNNNISNAKTARAASLAYAPDNLRNDLARAIASRKKHLEQQEDGQSVSSNNGSGNNNAANTNGVGGDKESWLADLIRKEISKEITKMKAEIIDAIKTELRQR